MRRTLAQRRLDGDLDEINISATDLLRELNLIVIMSRYININSLNPSIHSPQRLEIAKRLFTLVVNKDSHKIVSYILDHEAFTRHILEHQLMLSVGKIRNCVDTLERFGIVERADKIKLKKAGPPTLIYLLQGAKKQRINEAKQLHIDLQPTSVPKPLYTFENQQIVHDVVTQAIEYHEPRDYAHEKEIPTKYLLKKIRERQGFYSEATYNMVLEEVKARGWTILYG